MLFPLLATEIVISLAFWWLFAPQNGQFITRLLHGHSNQGAPPLAFETKRFSARSPAHDLGRFHPEAAFGQGCITFLLLGSVQIGGITGFRRAATINQSTFRQFEMDRVQEICR